MLNSLLQTRAKAAASAREITMTMYLEHFGLREAPFRITPHTEFFFSGANRGATLEEVRLLSNLETNKEKLLQLVLFGQPELDAHLALPGMRQLKERITHAFDLAPLPPRDVKDYVNFRLRQAGYHGPDLFGTEALAIIADASEGLTRRINIYADKTLLAAFAAGTHTVSPDHARAAVSDTQIVVTRRSPRRAIAAAAVIGVAAGIAIGYFAGQLASPGSAANGAAAVSTSAPTASGKPAAPAAVPAPVAATAPADAKPAEPKAASAKPLANAAEARPATPAESPNDAVVARLAAGKQLLEGTATGGYGVQLMVTDAREKAYLESYLAEAARSLKPETLYLFPAGSRETPRIGVLYGAFPERAEAVAALDAMPEALKQFRPYVRPLDGLREDVRRSDRR